MPNKHRKYTVIVIVIVLMILAPIVPLAWRSAKASMSRSGLYVFDLGYTIHFTIPNDFRGEFIVRKDTMNGQVIMLTPGTIPILVPQNGKAGITDMLPFMTWHVVEATYDDGAQLPCWGTDLITTGVCLNGAGSSGPYDAWEVKYFIGTREEFNNYYKNRR